MTGDLLGKAILNNIEWCKLVATSHEVQSECLSNAWRTVGIMPPFYPNVISTVAAIGSKELSQLAVGLPEKCAWKDCYANLELSEYGFSVLFESHWYALSGNPYKIKFSEAVENVSSVEMLKEWVAAWGETPLNQSIFIPKILKENVRFVFRNSAGTIDAGLILNYSDNSVGITNVFGDLDGIVECLGYAVKSASGVPLVGYGSKDELSQLKRLGFTGLGKLRVWVR